MTTLTAEQVADHATTIYPEAFAQVWPKHEAAIRNISPAMADHIASEGLDEVEDDEWYFVFANPVNQAEAGVYGTRRIKVDLTDLGDDELEDLRDACADFKDEMGRVCRELLPE